REHPEVYVPAAKEIYFFNRHYERGFDWYLSFFKKFNGEKACGELSHEYFLSGNYAERIHAHLPDAKIIFCLREGVERTFSAYLYDRTIFEHVGPKDFQRGLTFEAYATLPHIIKLSDYYRNMRPFFLLFPRDNILVLFYDDLKTNPGRFAQKLFAFLGVDPMFAPPSLYRIVNPARRARSDFFANLAYRGGQWLRKIGRPDVLGSVKRQGWFEKILYKSFNENEKPKIPLQTIEPLRKIYHKDYDKLADLIGTRPPDSWFRVK
ncbi:MAG TPA: sulfotransferase, partial [Candidatus Binatia bacterium]